MRKKIFLSLLIIIISINIYFKIYKINNIPGINGDEAWVGYTAKLIKTNGVYKYVTGMGNYTGLLYPLICSYFYKLTVSSIGISRFVCVLSNLLILIIFFIIFKKFSKLFLIILLLLFSLNPFLFIFSRWAMPHGLIPFFNIISFYFLYLFLEKKNVIYFILSLFLACISIQLLPSQILIVIYIIAISFLLNKKILFKIIFSKLFFILCLIFVIATSSVLVYNSKELVRLIKLDYSYIKKYDFRFLIEVFSIRAKVYFIKLFDTFNGLISLKYFSGKTSLNKINIYFLRIISILIFIISIYQLASKKLVKKINAFGVYFLFFSLPIFLETFNQNMHMPHLGEERYLLIFYPYFILLYSFFIYDFYKVSKKILKAVPILLLLIYLSLWCYEIKYDYFKIFTNTGGYGNKVYFLTKNLIDPKFEALQQIKNDNHSKKIIICQDYWIYWPIKYIIVNSIEIKWIPQRRAPREWKPDFDSIDNLNQHYKDHTKYYILWTDIRNNYEKTKLTKDNLWKQINKLNNLPLIDIYRFE